MQHEAVKIINTDRLAEIVGGRYALTTLVAKRLRSVNAGAPFLVEPRPGERTIETVCREIEEGRIWLETATPSETVETGSAQEISDLLDLD